MDHVPDQVSNLQTTQDLLGKLVSFDTTSRNSNLELITFIANYLEGFGIASKLVRDEAGGKANLFATIGPSNEPGYVLSGHTDVVPVDGQNWSHPPFKMIEKEGALYGRGTADMKGFIACVLAMVPAMQREALTAPFHLAFSYDEEVGCLGVRRLLTSLGDWGLSPKACIVGEPTNMQVVIGHKAKQSFEVVFHGHAAHSSLAPYAVNAIEYAGRLIAKIQEIGRRLAETGAKDDLYDVPFTTMQTNLIHGGEAANIIPDHCTMTFEIRANSLDDPLEIANEVKQYAFTVLEPEMRATRSEAHISFTSLTGYPGLDTSADSPLVALVKNLAERNDHAKVAYGAEAGLFDQVAGIPTLVCGPGSINQAHKPDEFIKISELEKCLRFLDRLIKHAATQKP